MNEKMKDEALGKTAEQNRKIGNFKKVLERKKSLYSEEED